MRVLAVSDKVNRFLYSPQVKKIVGDVDLIISCGDLPCYYLDYLVSTLGKPLCYICGNHDHYEEPRKFVHDMGSVHKFKETSFNYNKACNFGGKNLDEKSVNLKGMIISGLEGSFLYNKGEHQYSESQMRRKIRRITPSLLLNKITQGRYLDILVTHAAPRGIHDKDDLPHRGFQAYIDFIKRFRPKYLLHGHVHIYDNSTERITEYLGTTVINCYDYRIIELKV